MIGIVVITITIIVITIISSSITTILELTRPLPTSCAAQLGSCARQPARPRDDDDDDEKNTIDKDTIRRRPVVN